MMILISVTLPVAMTMAVTMVTVAMVTVTMGTATMWVCMPEGKNAYQVHHKSSNRHNLVRGHKQRIPTDFIPNWIQVLNATFPFSLQSTHIFAFTFTVTADQAYHPRLC